MSIEIQLDNISYAYGNKHNKSYIFKDFNISFEKGKINTILGTSGCGKSTLLDLIGNYKKPLSGTVTYANDLDSDKDIGIVFQQNALFPWKTVYQNIDFALRMGSYGKEQRHKLIMDYLNKFSLTNTENLYPGQLSGGMYARVSLLRILILQPKLILVDEAFSSLDSITKQKILTLFRTTIKENNQTAIVVTHDIAEALSISDRIIVMQSEPVMILREYNNLDLRGMTKEKLQQEIESSIKDQY